MSKLTDMPNIGYKLAIQLNEAGVETCEQLIELGSREAFLRLMCIDGISVCINRLYALEGAIQGIRWHYLSQDDRAKLAAFYHMKRSE